MNRLTLGVLCSAVLATFVGIAAVAREMPKTDGQASAKSVALRFIDALFTSRDPELASVLIDEAAPIRGQRRVGIRSLVFEEFTHDPAILNGDLKLVQFFDAADVPALSQKYPGDMWQADRPSAFIGPEGGCLALVDVAVSSDRMVRLCLGLVVRLTGGKYRITYLDDVDLPALPTDITGPAA